MRFAGSQLTNFIDGTNFDNIAKMGHQSRSHVNNASMESDALIDRADIQAEAEIEAAKYGAMATRAQGAAAGQSSMASGIGSMVSGIAGGFGNMGGSKTDLNTAVDRTSLGHGIPGSVGGNGLPMYGPSW